MKDTEKAAIKAAAAEYLAATLAAAEARRKADNQAHAARAHLKERLNAIWTDSHADPDGPLTIPYSIAAEIDGHTYIVQLDEDLEPHNVIEAEL